MCSALGSAASAEASGRLCEFDNTEALALGHNTRALSTRGCQAGQQATLLFRARRLLMERSAPRDLDCPCTPVLTGVVLSISFSQAAKETADLVRKRAELAKAMGTAGGRKSQATDDRKTMPAIDKRGGSRFPRIPTPIMNSRACCGLTLRACLARLRGHDPSRAAHAHRFPGMFMHGNALAPSRPPAHVSGRDQCHPFEI